MSLDHRQQELLNKILSKVGDLSFKRRVVKILEYLELKEGDLLLDAGCGEGFYLMLLRNLYGCRLVGIESDQKMLDLAQQWIKPTEKLLLQTKDICQMNFPENYFDKIICSEVLEHIDDDNLAVKNLFRVLKPGGVLVVTVPNKNYPLVWDPLNKLREALGWGHFDAKNTILGGIWSYDHKRLYDNQELESLLVTNGFRVNKSENLTHYGIPFSNVILTLGKWFYSQLPVPKAVKNSMEKFTWDTEETNSSWISKILNLGLRIFTLVDQHNNQVFGKESSSVNIIIKATK
jgi:ubiquinone/menaquinone biosynthesis C-methylase UbiE